MPGVTQTRSPCESCRIYQQEICVLQARIFSLETEKGLHETLPVESSGKTSTFTSKGEGDKTVTFNLNDTVSFPRLSKDNFNGLGARPKQSTKRGYVTSPGIKLTNRFLPLSETSTTEYNNQGKVSKISVNHEVSRKQQRGRKTVPNAKVKDTLVLGDGAISEISINRMVTCSYQSATVSDITKLLPEELAKNQGVKQLIVHVGAVDIRNKQSEVLKKDFEKLFESLDEVAIPTFISGPLPNIDRKINKFSRLLQLNTWLSKVCESRGLHFIENFNLFWQRDDLFKGKGHYLSRGGVRRLTDNLLHALRHQNRPETDQALPLRKERSQRGAVVSPPKDPGRDSDAVTTTEPAPPATQAAPAASQRQDFAPTVEPAAPATPAAPQRQDLLTSAPATPATPAATSPRSPPQVWDPPAASTPSREASLSFSSPPSPMKFPDRLESLVKSGIKMVPLTPDIARSRVRSPKSHRPPPPPQPTPPAKAPPARPPPLAVVANSVNAVI